MTSSRRFPPFAVLGGAAGWLWRDMLLSRFLGAPTGLITAIPIFCAVCGHPGVTGGAVD